MPVASPRKDFRGLRQVPLEFEDENVMLLAKAIQQLQQRAREHPIEVVSVTADYTMLDVDLCVLVDSTADDTTISLQTAAGRERRRVIVKKIAGSNAVIIDPAGSETIDGSATLSITSINASQELVSDGTNWHLISSTIVADAALVSEEIIEIVPDNTVAFYDIDVSTHVQVEILQDGVGFASSDRTLIRFSLDNGVTFKAGASDYNQNFVSSAIEGSSDESGIFTSTGGATTGHNTRVTVFSLQAGRASYSLGAGVPAITCILRQGFANFDGPITDIRLLSLGGANFNAGTIRVMGIK